MCSTRQDPPGVFAWLPPLSVTGPPSTSPIIGTPYLVVFFARLELVVSTNVAIPAPAGILISILGYRFLDIERLISA